MNERLFPDGFVHEYRRAFGDEPPEAFIEAYELLADSLYFGFGLQPEHVPGKFRGGGHNDGFFREPRLLDIKFAVDGRLAQARTALRTWQAKGRRASRFRRTPAPARRRDLGEVRRDGRNDPDRLQTEKVK